VGANETTRLYLLPVRGRQFRQRYREGESRRQTQPFPRDHLSGPYCAMKFDSRGSPYNPHSLDLRPPWAGLDELCLIVPNATAGQIARGQCPRLGRESFIAHNVTSP